jgi:short-subunit dehydrogenase
MKKGPVALITGASEGLGKYLALECASRGMHLVLVALPHSNLLSLARYISSTYGVQVWAFEKDLSHEENCTALYHAVKAHGISINILINNVGMGGIFFFDERGTEYYNTLIRLNAMAPMILTRLFLDDLRKSAPAFILNVSSIAGIFHPPKKSVYSGTKAFLMGFSKSLRRELKHEGISVSVLCPGAMNTSWQLMVLNRTMGSWLSRQSVLYPCEVATVAIDKMLAGKDVIVPGWWNRCFIVWSKIFPKWATEYLTQYAMRKAPPAMQSGARIEPALPAAVA